MEITKDVTFISNSTIATLDIMLPDDNIVDDVDETFIVELSNPVEATLGSPTRAVVEVSDSESKKP